MFCGIPEPIAISLIMEKAGIEEVGSKLFHLFSEEPIGIANLCTHVLKLDHKDHIK